MTDPSPSALERCAGDPERFLDQHWGRWPLHHVAAQGYEDLLSLGDVDQLVAGAGLRLPAFRLVKDGETVPTSRYTKRGQIGSQPVTGIADPRRIFEEFRTGATIVLQGMHRFWPPLARLCRDLELALGHPTQVNAYITPPGSRGLAVHSDPHDVFVLQAFGRKHWEVHEPGRPVDDPGTPVLSVELRPGESLYIPERTPHAARTQEVVSGHVTVGISAYRWPDLFRELFELAERDDRARERLPAAYHVHSERFAEETRTRLDELARWLEKADPAEAAAIMVRKFLTTRPPLLSGTLPGLLDLGSIGDDTVLRRRAGSVCELTVVDGRLSALLGDRELRMPVWLLPAMRFVAEQGDFRVGALDAWLDPEGRQVLARRLVREGLLETAPPGAG